MEFPNEVENTITVAKESPQRANPTAIPTLSDSTFNFPSLRRIG
jgi:hypothetical protein